MSRVVSSLCALLLACAALFGAPAFAVDSGDIIVVSSKGEVRITMNGAERNVRAGGVLELPASVHTGRDGNVELRQGATTVSVGPETLLEFPALEKRGAPIDRIVQPRGNAFYNIGKREGRKLRVETPYLVGVIKGTQFNVAAQDEATTISLFEGLLEVRATDDSSVVDLKAGEIASRKRGDKAISIIRMDAGTAPPTSSRPPSDGGSNDGATSPTAPRSTPSSEGNESLLVERVPTSVRPDLELNTDVRASESSAGLGTGVSVGADDTLDTGVNVVMNAAGTSISLGGTDLAADAAVTVGASGAEVVANVGVDVGPIATDLGVTAAVDVAAGTVDVGTAVGVDAGPLTADLGASTGVDLGAGTIDTSANTSIDAGPLTTDLAAGAAVDLSSGTVDTGVTVGASAPLVDVNVGVDVAADVAAGTVNVGLDVAGTDVGLGVDLTNPVGTVETVTGTVTDTVVDVGGLLNGLIRRPGRK